MKKKVYIETREAHAAKFNYDIDVMFRDLQEKEAQSGVKYVSFDPKAAKHRTKKRRPKKKLEKILV